MWYVYLIKNLINGKLYVGKTNSVQGRWGDHKMVAAGGKKKYPKKYRYLHSAISKHGANNFAISVLGEYTIENNSFDAEKEYIAKLKLAGNKLYNLTDGGEGASNYRHSVKQKQKMSAAKKGKALSVQHKKKLSILNAGSKGTAAKLSWSEVYEIRDLHSKGMSFTEISKRFNISRTTVSRICLFRTWTEEKSPINIEKHICPSKEELQELLWKEPICQVAKNIGVTYQTISIWANNLGCSRPPRGYFSKPIMTIIIGKRNCSVCRISYDYKNPKQKYCSRICLQKKSWIKKKNRKKK